MGGRIEPEQVARLAPLLQQAIVQGKASAEYYAGVWHDIGTPERLQELDRQLIEQSSLKN